MKSPHGLRMLKHGCDQGRLSRESHRATLACYFGLIYWLTAPFRWMRTLNVGEWCAILMVGIGICAWVSK